jgi:hypothetical protein
LNHGLRQPSHEEQFLEQILDLLVKWALH